MKIYNFLVLFLFISLELSAGFGAGTRVRTPEGSIPIEQLRASDAVITHKNIHPITHTHSYKVEHVIHIILSDPNQSHVVMSGAQRLYLPLQQQWKHADQLQLHDRVGIDELNYYSIESVECTYQLTTVYHIVVHTDHTFIVEPGLLAHNPAPAIGIGLAWAFGEGAIEFVGASFIMGILGTWFGWKCTKDIYHCHNKLKNNKYRKERVWCVGDYQISGVSGGPSPEDPEKNNKKHPHGIYENAPYHKAYQSGRKSPRPLDGQGALDNSVGIKDSSHRVGISRGQLVVLRETRPGVYHGYTCSWNNLPGLFRTALQKLGKVNGRGKIL